MNEPTNKNENHIVIPFINWNKCESDGICVNICPRNVFEMKTISHNQFSKLTFVGKLKTRVHRKKKAFVKYPEQCQVCGECFNACPEKAIKLLRL